MFHTDSQYHHQPERLFVLACDTPAEEGGNNLLLSVDDAREIAQKFLGDDAMARMKQSVWRWAVPEVFQSATVPAVSPPSAIFREDGSIRWRIDNLVCETDADQLLADTFEKALEGSSRSENFTCSFSQYQENAYIDSKRWKFAFPAAEQDETYRR